MSKLSLTKSAHTCFNAICSVQLFTATAIRNKDWIQYVSSLSPVVDEFWSIADTRHNDHNFLFASRRVFVDDVKDRPGWSSNLSRKKRPSVLYTHEGIKYRFRKISDTLFEWSDHDGNFCVSVNHDVDVRYIYMIGNEDEQVCTSILLPDRFKISIVSADQSGRTDFIERLVVLLSNTFMDDAAFSILESLRYDEVIVYDNTTSPVFKWLRNKPVDDIMATAFALSLIFNSSVICKMGTFGGGLAKEKFSEGSLCSSQEIEAFYNLVSESFNDYFGSNTDSGKSFGCALDGSVSNLSSSIVYTNNGRFLDFSRVLMLCIAGMHGTFSQSSKIPFTDRYYSNLDGIIESIQRIHKVVKKQSLEQSNSFEMDPMSYTSLAFFVRSVSKDYSFIKRMDEELMSEFFIRFVELKNSSRVSTTDDAVLIAVLYSMLDNSPKYFGNLVTETLTKRVFDKVLNSTDVNTLDDLDRNALRHIKFDDLKWTLSLLFYQEMHISIAFAYEIVRQMDCTYATNLQRVIGSFLTDLIVYQRESTRNKSKTDTAYNSKTTSE